MQYGHEANAIWPWGLGPMQYGHGTNAIWPWGQCNMAMGPWLYVRGMFCGPGSVGKAALLPLFPGAF